MGKVVFITGGSSGIGLHTGMRLIERGYKVYELSRRASDEGNKAGIIHINGDVTLENTIRHAVNTIIEKEKKIDVLLNCAGYGIFGAAEFSKMVDVKTQFEVNFFGTVRSCRYVVPHMRRVREGRIYNVSALAAHEAPPFQAFYSASKAALVSYSESLDKELKHFGIRVSAVLPGFVETSFHRSRKVDLDGDQVYEGRISGAIQILEKKELQGMQAAQAGEELAALIEKTSIKTLSVIGSDSRFNALLMKILPCRLVSWFIERKYR